MCTSAKAAFLEEGLLEEVRYIENDFREDLDKVIAYYNEQGYRDARIVQDTVWDVPQAERSPTRTASK